MLQAPKKTVVVTHRYSAQNPTYKDETDSATEATVKAYSHSYATQRSPYPSHRSGYPTHRSGYATQRSMPQRSAYPSHRSGYATQRNGYYTQRSGYSFTQRHERERHDRERNERQLGHSSHRSYSCIMHPTRLRSPRLATSGSQVSLGFSSTVPANNSGKDVILCVGDSLTAGKKGFRSYPSQLQRLLDDDGLQMRVHSSGVWGHTSQDVLKRLPSALQSAFTEGGRLAFVLILVGTNDLLHSHPHQLDYQIPNIVNNIRAICETAANAAFFPHVGVLTLPPLATRNPARLKLNHQLRHFMAGYAAQKGFSDRFLVDLESLDPGLAFDGVHYNDEGYMEFARRTRAAILPIIQSEAASKSRLVSKASRSWLGVCW